MASQKHYRARDWKHPSLDVGSSRIQGAGTFAKSFIGMGEVVWIFGGTVFAKDDIDEGRADKRTLMQIDEGLWLGNHVDEPLTDDYFINHSCDPNMWMKDEVTLIARRDIPAGQEVTMDYAMHFVDPDWVMRNVCSCGSQLCRRSITGRDWMLKELQGRYRDHFSPLINWRITKLSASQPSLRDAARFRGFCVDGLSTLGIFARISSHSLRPDKTSKLSLKGTLLSTAVLMTSDNSTEF